MANTFEYSILQYKHSQVLNEIVNVGIIFYFPLLNTFEFIVGDSSRVKSLYPEFDQSLFNKLVKSIQGKVQKDDSSGSLFIDSFKGNFQKYLHEYVLREDATVLEFSKPSSSVVPHLDPKGIIANFSSIYLPEIHKINHLEKRNEQYLIRKIKDYLFKDSKIEDKIETNKVVEHNGLNFKFDFNWQNGSSNLIKTISFDLLDQQTIQTKAATQFGNLTLLKTKALEDNYRFDLIISEPTSRTFFNAYEKAIEILEQIEAPKKLIFEKDIKQYTSETINYLLTKD